MNVFLDGNIEDVRGYLTERFGTPDFRVTEDGRIHLRLPDFGVDGERPPTDTTTLVEIDPTQFWTVHQPFGRRWTHAVATGARRSLCGIEIDQRAAALDDTLELTCPACRARLLAIEIALPSGPRRRPDTGRRSEASSLVDVAARGIDLVADEIRRRGGAAERVHDGRARNRLSVRAPGGRVLTVDVRTRTAGDWQTTIRHGHPRDPDPNETGFWVLVDLARGATDFYVMPRWWIENDIHKAHSVYLARHGGTRAQNPNATHHRITLDRVADWRGRWDLLGLAATSG